MSAFSTLGSKSKKLPKTLRQRFVDRVSNAIDEASVQKISAPCYGHIFSAEFTFFYANAVHDKVVFQQGVERAINEMGKRMQTEPYKKSHKSREGTEHAVTCNVSFKPQLTQCGEDAAIKTTWSPETYALEPNETFKQDIRYMYCPKQPETRNTFCNYFKKGVDRPVGWVQAVCELWTLNLTTTVEIPRYNETLDAELQSIGKEWKDASQINLPTNVGNIKHIYPHSGSTAFLGRYLGASIMDLISVLNKHLYPRPPSRKNLWRNIRYKYSHAECNYDDQIEKETWIGWAKYHWDERKKAAAIAEIRADAAKIAKAAEEEAAKVAKEAEEEAAKVVAEEAAKVAKEADKEEARQAEEREIHSRRQRARSPSRTRTKEEASSWEILKKKFDEFLT